MNDRKSKELKLTENNISIELNVEKQSRRETEIKITKMVDERLFNLKLDLAKEKKIREEAEERHFRTFGDQIQSGYGRIEKAEREG